LICRVSCPESYSPATATQPAPAMRCGRGWRGAVVVLLAVVVIGGLVWLARLRRGAGQTDRTRADGAGPGFPGRPLGGRRVPPELMPRGRIVVSGLTKEYSGVRAVDDLSFTVEPGRVTGFLGPNGAGKTTTLRMLLGLVEPTTGTATIGGVRYADLDEPIRRVGAILEAGAAHKDRTGRNHLRIVCQSAGIPLARADEVLELVGLSLAGNRTFRGYSLGMRQRLGVAAALLADPQVLILDEPANGLDPEGIRWMRDLLRTLAAQGRTILVSSHLLGEMEQLADDLVIIAAGRLAAQGTVASVLGSMTYLSRTLVRTPELEKLAVVLGGDAVVTPADDGGAYITGVDAAAIGDAALRAGVAIHQLVTQRADLEAAFLELTAGKAVIR
jgi:ABC-2 type transport system ATP-binding protein